MQLWGGVVYLSILGSGFGGDCTEGGRMESWSKSSYSQVQAGNGDCCVGCGEIMGVGG